MIGFDLIYNDINEPSKDEIMMLTWKYEPLIPFLFLVILHLTIWSFGAGSKIGSRSEGPIVMSSVGPEQVKKD